MKEMSANGQNPMMSFYGEMPDSYNFVVNAAHPLVAKILSEEEAECAAKVKPIVDEIAALEAKRKDLKGDKKDEDLAQAIKDEIKDIDAKLAKNGEAKSDVFEAFAKSNKTVQQLVDLALLSNNLLKGEALSDFVKRSVAML
jgi:molecular chaperone HtpG